MRMLVVLGAASLICAASAVADFGSIITSWEAPSPSIHYPTPRGVAWDGEYIWCNCTYVRSGTIYRCVADSGSVVSSFKTPFIIDRSGGGINCRKWRGRDVLEFSVWDEYLDAGYIFRLDFDGQVINWVRVRLPGATSDYFSSLTFDGVNYWVVRPMKTTNEIYKLTETGSVISSFMAWKHGGARGIAKQGDFFWLSCEDNYRIPFFFGAAKVNTSGTVVATFEVGQTMYDCAYENNHLWVGGNSRYVYCFDVANAPAVAPASLGRVKALFR